MQLAEGNVQYQEPMLLETLFDLAYGGARAQATQALPVHPIPERLEVATGFKTRAPVYTGSQTPRPNSVVGARYARGSCLLLLHHGL